MKRILFFLLVIVQAGALHAQTKNTAHVNQVWAGYFNQTRFSDKWGMWVDIQLRSKENFLDNLSQSLNRAGLTYYINDNTRLTLGYAFINHFPGNNHANISRPEHRIWQQVQWQNKYPRLRLMQWFRLEEKFLRRVQDNDNLAEGNNYSWKLRYNFLLNTPLGKKAFTPGSLSFVLNDEVHINFGKEIVYNYFDQNRFFVGFNYHTTTADNIQFGYMNLFQQLAAGNSYRNVHTLRVGYFHNLDLRKK